MDLFKIAKNIVADYKYIHDPKHQKKPSGEFYPTDKGWSNNPKYKNNKLNNNGNNKVNKKPVPMKKNKNVVNKKYDWKKFSGLNNINNLQKYEPASFELMKKDSGIHSAIVLNYDIKTKNGNLKTIFKTDQYESGSSKKEKVGYELSELFGINLVPPTTITNRDKVGKQFGLKSEGSEQTFVTGKQYCKYSPSERNKISKLKDFQKLALFDVVLGNEDRHAGNFLYDNKENKIFAIDNGFSLSNSNNFSIRSEPLRKLSGKEGQYFTLDSALRNIGHIKFDQDVVDDFMNIDNKKAEKILKNNGLDESTIMAFNDRINLIKQTLKYQKDNKVYRKKIKNEPEYKKKSLTDIKKKNYKVLSHGQVLYDNLAKNINDANTTLVLTDEMYEFKKRELKPGFWYRRTNEQIKQKFLEKMDPRNYRDYKSYLNARQNVAKMSANDVVILLKSIYKDEGIEEENDEEINNVKKSSIQKIAKNILNSLDKF